MKKKEKSFKRVVDLSREELESIVESIQGWLWVGEAPEDAPKVLKNCEVWNPDMKYDPKTVMKNIVDIMKSYKLRPDKVVKFDG